MVNEEIVRNHIKILSDSVSKSIRDCIRQIYKINELKCKRQAVSDLENKINLLTWIKVLSYMCRRIQSVYLGNVEYDDHIIDLKLSFTLNIESEVCNEKY